MIIHLLISALFISATISCAMEHEERYRYESHARCRDVDEIQFDDKRKEMELDEHYNRIQAEEAYHREVRLSALPNTGVQAIPVTEDENKAPSRR